MESNFESVDLLGNLQPEQSVARNAYVRVQRFRWIAYPAQTGIPVLSPCPETIAPEYLPISLTGKGIARNA
jgi:hypothetical protein